MSALEAAIAQLLNAIDDMCDERLIDETDESEEQLERVLNFVEWCRSLEARS